MMFDTVLEKKVLFVSENRPGSKSGSGVGGTVHYYIFKQLLGKAMYSVIVDGTSRECLGNDEFFRTPNAIMKASAILRGNPPYLYPAVVKRLFCIIKNFRPELLYFDNSVSGRIIRKIKKRFPKIRVICFFHDIESVLMREWMKSAGFLRRISLKTMIKNEAVTVKFADKCIVLNEREKKLYEEVYGVSPDGVVPISIIKPQISVAEKRKHVPGAKLKLLFVGTFYKMNVDGLTWFVKNVLPETDKVESLEVVGYNIEKFADLWASDTRVKVYGTVDDLGAYYQAADVVIAPIFSGGGMKTKTCEALYYGKVFIGASESLVGYWENLENTDFCGKIVFKCNTEKEYFNALDKLYGQEFDIPDSSIAAWCDKYYSFESALNKYKAIIWDKKDI